MDWQTSVSFIIILILTLLIIFKRKEFEFLGKFPFFYAGMWRTKLGLKLMNIGADKLGWFIRPLSITGIYVGFVGMFFIFIEIIRSTVMLFIKPEAAPSAQLVLPISMPGVVTVPFLFWILSIFIIATIHEFSHGIVARSFKIKVKSSGFAFLGIFIPLIPAAFVEPDEKMLEKKPKKHQLAVFAAGPWSNILFSILLILLFFPAKGLLSHITDTTNVVNVPKLGASLFKVTGFTVKEVAPNSAANIAGIAKEEKIFKINDLPPGEELLKVLNNLKPKQKLKISTDKKDYNVVLKPRKDDSTKGQIGIVFDSIRIRNPEAVKKYGIIGFEFILFIIKLMTWVLFLGLGIGLFNLAPLGPVDGGRMLLVSLKKFMPEKKAIRTWKHISIYFGTILIFLIVVPFIRRLFYFFMSS